MLKNLGGIDPVKPYRATLGQRCLHYHEQESPKGDYIWAGTGRVFFFVLEAEAI